MGLRGQKGISVSGAVCEGKGARRINNASPEKIETLVIGEVEKKFLLFVRGKTPQG